MKYQVQESEETRGAFSVTAIGRQGEIYSTRFSGPKAKERAEEYAAWKNSELDMPKSPLKADSVGARSWRGAGGP